MRVTRRQLRRIIKEEKAKVLAGQKVRRLVRRKLIEQSRVERDTAAARSRVAADPDSAWGAGPHGTINTEEELMDMIMGQEVSIEGGQEIRIAGEKHWTSTGGRAAVVYDIADVMQDMLADANGDFFAVLEKLESVAKSVTFDGWTERALGITARDSDKYP
jgi:hypothetical protein